MFQEALATGGGHCMQDYSTCPPLVARATMFPSGNEHAIDIEFARSDEAETQLDAGVSPSQEMEDNASPAPPQAEQETASTRIDSDSQAAINQVMEATKAEEEELERAARTPFPQELERT
eukprot:2263236-Alexandrium_andersonii.AAC.1